MISKKAAGIAQDDSRRTAADLNSKYGEIGISAVAAALQYKSDSKNPAYAPAVPQSDDTQSDKLQAELAA